MVFLCHKVSFLSNQISIVLRAFDYFQRLSTKSYVVSYFIQKALITTCRNGPPHTLRLDPIGAPQIIGHLRQSRTYRDCGASDPSFCNIWGNAVSHVSTCPGNPPQQPSSGFALVV